MKIRPRVFVPLLVASALLSAACNSTPETPQEKAKTAATADKKKPKVPTIPDQSNDTAFQSFLSRLRQAVHQHDVDALAGLMTKDFGYRLDPPGEGDGVFAYWDQNNIWPELELILREKFIPKENYMVAPPEFIINPASYNGYRAGIRLENGGWKFAYFVADGQG